MTKVACRSVSIPLACGIGCVGAATAFAGYQSVAAARSGRAAPAPVLAVTAGKPSELAFTLSRSSALPWAARASLERITFKVTNEGTLTHDFKVCTTPVKHASANSCDGKATKLLRPGQSTTLTVSFTRRGTYEYLCTLPGEAAGGMKGLIGIGVKLATTSSSTPTGPETTATTTTTTAPATGAPSSLVGNANSGKAVFASAGCASCHTLAAAGASGTTGPSLDSVKPTQPVIVEFVTDGSTTGSSPMPAYAGTLTPTQIDDLAAYVYLTTHTIN